MKLGTNMNRRQRKRIMRKKMEKVMICRYCLHLQENPIIKGSLQTIALGRNTLTMATEVHHNNECFCDEEGGGERRRFTSNNHTTSPRISFENGSLLATMCQCMFLLIKTAIEHHNSQNSGGDGNNGMELSSQQRRRNNRRKNWKPQGQWPEDQQKKLDELAKKDPQVKDVYFPRSATEAYCRELLRVIGENPHIARITISKNKNIAQLFAREFASQYLAAGKLSNVVILKIRLNPHLTDRGIRAICAAMSETITSWNWSWMAMAVAPTTVPLPFPKCSKPTRH